MTEQVKTCNNLPGCLGGMARVKTTGEIGTIVAHNFDGDELTWQLSINGVTRWFQTDALEALGASVTVVAKTWNRESHGLFDYEAQSDKLISQTFSTTAGSVDFVRRGTNVEVIPENQPLGRCSENSKGLVRLVKKQSDFWIETAWHKRPWLQLRDLASGQKLSEGDEIKLGRKKFRVRQLATSSSGEVQPDLRLDCAGAPCLVDKKVELESSICRICLLEGSDEDDPLISPCKCKGSIEYVHLGCIRHWIHDRMKLPEVSGRRGYFFRPLTCELCKTPYPTQVRTVNGEESSETMPFAQVPQLQPPFMVLESREVNHPGLHVLPFGDKALTLGRGHECDVRIGDVSMSRCHATISLDEGGVVLRDNSSKFGTLVRMSNSRKLEANCPIAIQADRTVLAITLQTPPETALKD